MGAIINIAKTTWLFLWADLMSIILFVPMMIAALLSHTGNLAFTISKQWARVMLFATGTRVHIKNRGTIKEESCYVIISNHQSQFDILALVTAPGIQFRWVIKRELAR